MLKRSPIDHLDDMLSTRIRKGRIARDALLKQHDAPVWLYGRPKDTELGEASPAMVYLAQSLASSLGVAAEHLPALIALVWEGYGMDAKFTLEVRRFLRVADFMVRDCAPRALDHFHQAKAATMLREAPVIRDEDSFYTLFGVVSDAMELVGDAKTFESQAKSLDEALRIRAVGFGVVAMMHAKTTIEGDFQPKIAIPEMRALYQRFLPVLAGVRSLPGQTETVDQAALGLFRDVVRMDETIFAADLTRLDAGWAKTQPKSS